MVYYGKLLYLKDLLVPFKSDAQKMNYSPEEIEWAKLMKTKFGDILWNVNCCILQIQICIPVFFILLLFQNSTWNWITKLRPGWDSLLGWQIVRQYMEKNDVSVEEMLNTDAETIFKQSNYKPKK